MRWLRTSYLKTFLDLYEVVVELTKTHFDSTDTLISLKERGHTFGTYSNTDGFLPIKLYTFEH